MNHGGCSLKGPGPASTTLDQTNWALKKPRINLEIFEKGPWTTAESLIKI